MKRLIRGRLGAGSLLGRRSASRTTRGGGMVTGGGNGGGGGGSVDANGITVNY